MIVYFTLCAFLKVFSIRALFYKAGKTNKIALKKGGKPETIFLLYRFSVISLYFSVIFINDILCNEMYNKYSNS